MTDIHFRVAPARYACDVESRWGSQHITATDHKVAVTCAACKNTAYYASARQRIPTIPVPVYRNG